MLEHEYISFKVSSHIKRISIIQVGEMASNDVKLVIVTFPHQFLWPWNGERVPYRRWHPAADVQGSHSPHWLQQWQATGQWLPWCPWHGSQLPTCWMVRIIMMKFGIRTVILIISNIKTTFIIIIIIIIIIIVIMVNCHLVYSQLVYYPFRLITQPRFSGLGLGSRIRVRVLV